jgi:hypothetical protein
VVKQILKINSSSLFLRTFTVVEPIAARCDNSLGPNVTHLDALLQQVNIGYGDKSVQATVVDKCPSCGDQGIGACQNTGTCGSFHPLDFLVRHVPRCVPKACCPYCGCNRSHLGFTLEVVGGGFFAVVGRYGARCATHHTQNDHGDLALSFIWIYISSTLCPTVLNRACDDLDGHSWTSDQATTASVPVTTFFFSATTVIRLFLYMWRWSSHRASCGMCLTHL